MRSGGRRRLAGAARFAALALALAICGEAGARTVRVATFNIENYLPMNRRVEGRFRPDYPKPEAEKGGVRQAIHACRPDVLALQEMGAAPYLEELRQDLAREGLAYDHSVLLEAVDPERHTAVLSLLPFGEVVRHADLEFDYFGGRERVKRGLLEIRFSSPAGEWTLFVVHLKSRFTDRPDDPMSATRRLLEAQVLRDRIAARATASGVSRFIVAGDFNDAPASRPVEAFLHIGDRALALAVPATDSRSETWTHLYRRGESYARVDFILVSPALSPLVAGGRGSVYDGPGSLVGSDHRLVYADFDFGATN